MSMCVVSHRLPVVLARAQEGAWRLEPGTGGLVTALRPVLQNRGGTWVGSLGSLENEVDGIEEILEQASRSAGLHLRHVTLTAEERQNFYYGFSNEVIWPLFHDAPSRSNFRPEYWSAYQSANRKFAEATAEQAAPDDFIWVHDYQLMGMAKSLRELSVHSRIAFFLHIPFPPLDIFLQLPWRFQILHALLEYDLIGFQTLRDRRNFAHCVRALVKDVEIMGKGTVLTARLGSREVRIGAFPISIDFQEFATHAAEDSVSAKVRSLRADEPGRTIILGVDRLDYTKGIPRKLEAFRRALELFPDLQGKTTLLQVVVPSREQVPEYMEFKARLERLVGEINGQFTRSGWVPIHYIFRSLPREKLLAYYRAADIALVTPLKDGMNLVAKEYCAANLAEDGVLILSEFAGAAAQLQQGALLVNPYDIEAVAHTLAHAVRSTPLERRIRMRKLRRSIRRNDIFRWLDSYLVAAFARNLSDFPMLDDYVPRGEWEHDLCTP